MIIYEQNPPCFDAKIRAPYFGNPAGNLAPYQGLGSIESMQSEISAIDAEMKAINDRYKELKKRNSNCRRDARQCPPMPAQDRARLQQLSDQKVKLNNDIKAEQMVINTAVDLAKEINRTLEERVSKIIGGLEQKKNAVEKAVSDYEKLKAENAPANDVEMARKDAIAIYNSFAEDLKELQEICNQIQANAEGKAWEEVTVNNLRGMNGFFDKIVDVFQGITDPIVKPLVTGVKAVIDNPLKLVNPVAHVKGLYEAQKDFISEMKKQRTAGHAAIRGVIKKAIGEKAYNFTSNIAQKATPYVVIAASVVLTIVTAGAATPLSVAAITASAAGAFTGQALKDIQKEQQEDLIKEYTETVNEVINLQQDQITTLQNQQGNQTISVYETTKRPASVYSPSGWFDKFSCFIGYCPKYV